MDIDEFEEKAETESISDDELAEAFLDTEVSCEDDIHRAMFALERRPEALAIILALGY